MPALSEHSNVDTTALVILRNKGWQVWVERHDGDEHYWCERDGWDLNASSPTALLGLVAIFEHRSPVAFQEYWWREADAGRSREEVATEPTLRARVARATRVRRCLPRSERTHFGSR
jgi:hypothetical protein